GKVKIDGKTVTIEGKDGEKITANLEKGEDGKITTTVTNKKGEVAKWTADGKKMTMETAEGTAEWGAAKIPDGFPLPVIDGAKIVSAASSTLKKKGTMYHVALTVKKAANEVADFYETALEKEGLSVQRTEHKMAEANMVMLNGRKGEKVHAAVNISGRPGKDEVTVMINWTQK
ncbi:MAG: hypothetical protein V3T05_09845, partial [Myxococcota bacterium]